MPRYSKRPRVNGWVDDEGIYDEPQRNMIDVPEHEPTFTGLLDANGDEIWREPRPIGFGRDEDW